MGRRPMSVMAGWQPPHRSTFHTTFSSLPAGICTSPSATTPLVGRGQPGDAGPGGLATLAGPKGLACARGSLYVADTENHVVRRIDLESGIITTALGTGRRGDGPEPDPLRCALSRPHGVFVDAGG